MSQKDCYCPLLERKHRDNPRNYVDAFAMQLHDAVRILWASSVFVKNYEVNDTVLGALRRIESEMAHFRITVDGKTKSKLEASKITAHTNKARR
jgi:hypothetical protein